MIAVSGVVVFDDILSAASCSLYAEVAHSLCSALKGCDLTERGGECVPMLIR